MSSVAISVENLAKEYKLGLTVSDFWTVQKQFVGRLLRREHADDGSDDTIWALDDVSFDVRPGEVLGIVGRNGAGKSTLLKILSRITEPTRGQATIHGRVGSLLEVGTGFHPELTGRDNVYLNGAVLGMTRAEVRRKFDEIVAFAEIDRFIDTPVKRYSSGMYVRLAFAVAAHLEPEILIVDEVLAVGDVGFQRKCLGKMNAAARSGRTVLFVSHNMGAIAELCSRAILLEQGRIRADGEVQEVLERYSQVVSEHARLVQIAPDPSAPAAILAVGLENGAGEPTTSFDLADEIVITIRYSVPRRIDGLQLTVTLARNMVDVVHSFDTDELDEIPTREAGVYEARFALPGMFLKAGIYSARITAGTPTQLIQDLQGVLSFEIEERSVNTHMRGFRKDRPGLVVAPGTWETHLLEPSHGEIGARSG
jgi:lipopolysaccharide transport system ATP-binding protein